MENKTIAQQLNVKEFPFEITDENGNIIYREDLSGFWYKSEFDKYGNETYLQNSEGYSFKQEFDENNDQIYFEDSDGNIVDNRPKVKEVTIDELEKVLINEIANILGIKIKY